MKELFKAASTNGRWGMVIAGPEDYEQKEGFAGINTGISFFGKLIDLGEVNGFKTYRFDPLDPSSQADGGNWFLVMDDAEAMVGAEKIFSKGLQSGRVVTLFALASDFAVVREWGYDRRSSWFVTYVNGKKQDVPDAVLVAAGVVEPPHYEEVKVEVENPTTTNAALAEALRAAGLVK